MFENKNNIIAKRKKLLSNQDNTDIFSLAKLIINEVTIFLGSEVDELNTNAFQFKTSIERSIHLVLNAAHKKENDSLLIFPDMIPCFTIIINKKHNDICLNIKNNQEETKKHVADPNLNEKAVEVVLEAFFKKNKEKFILIESECFNVILVPLQELRNHLKKHGLYII